MSQQEESKEEKMKKIMRAGKVMEAVESGSYSKGHVDPTAFEGSEGGELMEQKPNMGPQMDSTPTPDSFGEPSMGEDEGIDPSKMSTNDLSKLDEDTRKDMIEKSNLPDPVKKQMLENPTPKPDPSAAMTKSFSMDDVKNMMGGDLPNQGGDKQMMQEQQPTNGQGWVKEEKPNSGGSTWTKEEISEQQRTPVSEEPSTEELLEGTGPASKPNPRSGDGGELLNEERTRNLIKEEFINLMFNDNIKNSLIKEVKEQAVKEAIRDIKNKLKKSKKRSSGTSK